jgi:hypothetical protein
MALTGRSMVPEEKEAIAPAIEMARKEGIRAEGPFPVDTIYLRIKKGNYNAIVSILTPGKRKELESNADSWNDPLHKPMFS